MLTADGERSRSRATVLATMRWRVPPRSFALLPATCVRLFHLGLSFWPRVWHGEYVL